MYNLKKKPERPVAVEISDVTKEFTEEHAAIRALGDVGFRVYEGELFALVGPANAGKTTMLRLIAGEIPPDRGGICVFGSPAESRDARLITAFVPEVPVFRGFQTGRSVLLEAARENGVPLCYVAHEADRVIAETSLGIYSTRKIKTYSEAQVYRLAAAAALLTRPRLLLLDNPGGVLSESERHWLADLLRKLAERKTAVVFTGRQITSLEHAASRIGVLTGGRYVEETDVSRFTAAGQLEAWFGGITSR